MSQRINSFLLAPIASSAFNRSMKLPRIGSLGLPAVLVLARVVSLAAPFDAAPFALPLPEGPGLMWEDPRELHRVVVHFQAAAPAPSQVRLEYWGSRWPRQHLPKDREPGGGDVGWMELGNWWSDGWRVADAEAQGEGARISFTFRPVNAKECPNLADYPARFRYTLKLRITSDQPLPAVARIEAFTDSFLEKRSVKLAWAKPVGPSDWRPEVFNGERGDWTKTSETAGRFQFLAAVNPDPNTFDRTLVTLRRAGETFTFKFDDLAQGPLFLPAFGVAVLPDNDGRDYAALAAEQKARGAKTLYDRVAEMPERTWQGAWAEMPPKKSHIYFPLGLDGGRQRFRLNADGSIDFRSNDHYLKARPGMDTPRLEFEKPNVHVGFGLNGHPSARTLEEETLPICITAWDIDGVRVTQTALVTDFCGTRPEGPAPSGDTLAVFMAEFTFSNLTETAKTAVLPVRYKSEGGTALRVDENGFLWLDGTLRGQVVASTNAENTTEGPRLTWRLEPGQWRYAAVKIPYCVRWLDAAALDRLGFMVERKAVAGYWRRRLNESAHLITPEPMLKEFYRSHAMHLLVNCEREPKSDRRFARVGSFGYGAYGNESCMMVVDLERRGYHQEAQNCLDAWLHYQGTVSLPGSFASKEGVLYGAGGYEAGGYNQHHGWILWMLAEHYRFTRDRAWLEKSAPGLIQGADWIIRETARTQDRHELERGLLPAGSLEDIGDWWTWLSTSCYTWRGLDSAAWALEQMQSPQATRIRQAADAYHATLLRNFRQASERSPVVRLRDGTAVPKIPSHVHRRGRSFGWICETLEGAIHLLITGALDPKSREAEWILKDYEDNLYLSNQYGYALDDFERHWFGRGGMSMQACLLLDVEPYLYRDDVKHALRALFNGQAVSYFPDVRMNTEHALPQMGDWRGDHFKSSDEANTAGWLRYLFVREEGDTLLVGQAVPRGWLAPGQRCGLERTATWFGSTSILYSGEPDRITAQLTGPRRNPPKDIRLRFREPTGRTLSSVRVNGEPWKKFAGEWVTLPGDIGGATIIATYPPQR
jgi:hypothetical protein